MTERHGRLVRCFSAVFPDLAIETISALRIEDLDAWDSLAAVRLVAVVEEEFGVRIDLRDLKDLSSFRAFETYLEKQGGDP